MEFLCGRTAIKESPDGADYQEDWMAVFMLHVCCDCRWKNVQRADDLAWKQIENIVCVKLLRL